MLTQQKPSKNITSKSRATELFNAPKIIQIGLRRSEIFKIPDFVFYFRKKTLGLASEILPLKDCCQASVFLVPYRVVFYFKPYLGGFFHTLGYGFFLRKSLKL